MSENINANIEQQPTNATPAETGDQGEKLFTQADLDRIIGERLVRAKRDTDSDKREADLTARENRLTCKEFLSEEKLPTELAGIIPTADVETFKANVQRLAKLFRSM